MDGLLIFVGLSFIYNQLFKCSKNLTPHVLAWNVKYFMKIGGLPPSGGKNNVSLRKWNRPTCSNLHTDIFIHPQRWHWVRWKEGARVSIVVATDGAGQDRRDHLDCSLNASSERPAKAAELPSAAPRCQQAGHVNIHTPVISNLQGGGSEKEDFLRVELRKKHDAIHI